MGELTNLRDELDGDRIVIRSASAIKPEEAEFLLPGRIPLAAVTLLVGRVGLGKSTLALDIAARVSRGQFGRDPAEVIIASAEDSPAHTIVPRLSAAGADQDRIKIVTMKHDGFEGGLRLPDDIADLEGAVSQVGAELVIIDPIVAHLAVGIDSHKDHSVRTALGPVAHLAANTGTAVVGIGHLNKGDGGHPLDRVGGSIGFTAAARSVLLFATDPETDEDDPGRLLAHLKSNLSPLAVALRFRIERRIIEHTGTEIETSGVAWVGEALGIEAAGLLRHVDPAERPQRDLAAETILAELEAGEKAWTAIKAVLSSEGISEKTGQRSRDELKQSGLITRSKAGLHGGWTWRLAEDGHELRQYESEAKNELGQANFEDRHDIGVDEFDGQVDPLDEATVNVLADFATAVEVHGST